MPHPDILKVLAMTPAEWGALPFHDETRQKLKAKAIAILSGEDVPLNTSTKALAIHDAQALAEASGNITRAGFEQAMIQQAKMFGEAVEQLRVGLQTLREEVTEQIRVMEDSRADFTHIVLERLKAVEEKGN